MNNKVLIKLIVPDIDETYELFIPVNEIVWKIKKLVLKAIEELCDSNVNLQKDYTLMNINTSKIYTDNEIIRDTDIRNATELIIF